MQQRKVVDRSHADARLKQAKGAAGIGDEAIIGR
jgi:hypothetical protein